MAPAVPALQALRRAPRALGCARNETGASRTELPRTVPATSLEMADFAVELFQLLAAAAAAAVIAKRSPPLQQLNDQQIAAALAAAVAAGAFSAELVDKSLVHTASQSSHPGSSRNHQQHWYPGQSPCMEPPEDPQPPNRGSRLRGWPHVAESWPSPCTNSRTVEHGELSTGK